MKKTLKGEENKELGQQNIFKTATELNHPILMKGLGQEYSNNILENISKMNTYSKGLQQDYSSQKVESHSIQNSIHVREPHKFQHPNIPNFQGEVKWPFFRVKIDENIKRFWDRRTHQDYNRNWQNEQFCFQGIMLRIGRKKKAVKGYYYRLTYTGLLTYYKKESDKEPKGFIKLSYENRVIISFQKTKKGVQIPVLYLERVEGLGITIFDHQMDQTLKLSECLQEFCLMRGFDYIYNKVDTLGSGAFATVFKVTRKRDDQTFAAKTIQRHMFEDNKHKEKFIQMIYNEVIALKQFDHPGIEKIYEIYQEKDRLIIIIEYCQGGTLYQFYKQKGKLNEKQIAYIIKGILDALFEMHSNGFVHRDLKLENIMMETKDSMHIKLVDFGFAEKINEKELLSKAGTPGFLAPEIFKSQPYTSKGDIFSVGVILYILAAGYAPFRGKPSQIQVLNSKCQISYEKSPWPDLSPELKFLVKKMLEAKVEERFTTLEALESTFILHHIKLTSETNYKSYQIVSGLDFHKQSIKSIKNSDSNGSRQSKEFQLDFSIHTNDIKSLYQKNSIKTLQSNRSGRTINQSMKLKQSISAPRDKDLIIEQYQGKRKQSQPDKSSEHSGPSQNDSLEELLKLKQMKVFEDIDTLNLQQASFLKRSGKVFNTSKRPQ